MTSISQLGGPEIVLLTICYGLGCVMLLALSQVLQWLSWEKLILPPASIQWNDDGAEVTACSHLTDINKSSAEYLRLSLGEH